MQLINISQAGRLWKDGEFNSQVKTKLLNWKWNITNHSMEGEVWKSSQKLRLLFPVKCFCGGKFDRTNVNFFTIWFLNSYPSQNNNFKWYLSNRMGLDGEACVLRLLCEVILSQTNIHLLDLFGLMHCWLIQKMYYWWIWWVLYQPMCIIVMKLISAFVLVWKGNDLFSMRAF